MKYAPLFLSNNGQYRGVYTTTSTTTNFLNEALNLSNLFNHNIIHIIFLTFFLLLSIKIFNKKLKNNKSYSIKEISPNIKYISRPEWINQYSISRVFNLSDVNIHTSGLYHFAEHCLFLSLDRHKLYKYTHGESNAMTDVNTVSFDIFKANSIVECLNFLKSIDSNIHNINIFNREKEIVLEEMHWLKLNPLYNYQSNIWKEYILGNKDFNPLPIGDANFVENAEFDEIVNILKINRIRDQLIILGPPITSHIEKVLKSFFFKDNNNNHHKLPISKFKYFQTRENIMNSIGLVFPRANSRLFTKEWLKTEILCRGIKKLLSNNNGILSHEFDMNSLRGNYLIFHFMGISIPLFKKYILTTFEFLKKNINFKRQIIRDIVKEIQSLRQEDLLKLLIGPHSHWSVDYIDDLLKTLDLREEDLIDKWMKESSFHEYPILFQHILKGIDKNNENSENLPEIKEPINIEYNNENESINVYKLTNVNETLHTILSTLPSDILKDVIASNCHDIKYIWNGQESFIYIKGDKLEFNVEKLKFINDNLFNLVKPNDIWASVASFRSRQLRDNQSVSIGQYYHVPFTLENALIENHSLPTDHTGYKIYQLPFRKDGNLMYRKIEEIAYTMLIFNILRRDHWLTYDSPVLPNGIINVSSRFIPKCDDVFVNNILPHIKGKYMDELLEFGKQIFSNQLSKMNSGEFGKKFPDLFLQYNGNIQSVINDVYKL